MMSEVNQDQKRWKGQRDRRWKIKTYWISSTYVIKRMVLRESPSRIVSLCLSPYDTSKDDVNYDVTD